MCSRALIAPNTDLTGKSGLDNSPAIRVRPIALYKYYTLTFRESWDIWEWLIHGNRITCFQRPVLQDMILVYEK